VPSRRTSSSNCKAIGTLIPMIIAAGLIDCLLFQSSG